MKVKLRQQLARRKRRIERRIDTNNLDGCRRPMFTASAIHSEMADRSRAIAHAGIGALHALARQVGLIDAIDRRLHVLAFHLPYHESDHVLTFAYHALCDGTCLQDLELRRQDEAFLDALGARRIPDPTTAGDFCRRLDEASIRLLQDIVHDVRIGVWAEQPADFFTQAIIDMDGTLVTTTGQCKQGMAIAYNGTWGYHPLVLTLANTGEVLGLVNRPGNRPSHEGAAAEVDRALAVCFRSGFAQVLLRGDTDFSQTEHLDRWDADPRVRFVFGYDATANLKALAEALPAPAWKRLQRPPRYAVQTQPRERPANVKEAVVVERQFKNIQLDSEDVAEFNYQPTVCATVYRMIVVRKNLSVAKGEKRLFDDVRYFFYITNDWVSEATEIVWLANDRCQQENLLAAVAQRRARVAGAGGQPAEQLGVHGDDGAGLGPEGMVGAAAAGGAGAVAGEAPDGEALGAGVGVQDVCKRLRAVAVSDRADGWAAGGSAALLKAVLLKSASGCADPPRPRVQLRRKEEPVMPMSKADRIELIGAEQDREGPCRATGLRAG